MKSRFLCAFLLGCLVAVAQQPSRAPQVEPASNQTSLDTATRAEVAERFAQLLADEYAYPDLGAKMAAAIRARLKAGAYDSLKSPPEFANALQTDARAVSNDLHLRVGFGVRQMQMRPGAETPEMAAQARQQNGGISTAQVLEGNIGYLALDIQVRQDEVAKDAIAAAFAFLHNTDALIIDLRGNPGGNGPAELFLSYLSEGTPFLASTVHWRKDNRVQEFRTVDLGERSYGARKPVFVLTSRTTFSAAEALAYELQSFKRGVIVGETTGGGANPSGGAGLPPLGHGFSVNIPMGYVMNPVTGTNWEGVGVKPDVDVPASEALARAWSMAADRLKTSALNPQRRAVLELLSSAKLGGAPSLTNAQLAGTYRAGAGDVQVTIVDKDGKLYLEQRQPYSAEIALTAEGGDRYRPDVFSAAFSLTFVGKDGKVELLRSDPRGAAVFGKQ